MKVPVTIAVGANNDAQIVVDVDATVLDAQHVTPRKDSLALAKYVIMARDDREKILREMLAEVAHSAESA